MPVHQVVVGVKAAQRDQEHLALGPQLAARGDQARHHLELLVQRAAAPVHQIGQHGVELAGAAGQRPRQRGVRVERAGGDAVELAFQHLGARLRDQRAQRLATGLGAVHAIVLRHALDRHRATGADLVGQRMLARQEHRVAGDRHAGEQRAAAVAGQRQVAQPATPALDGALGGRALPDRLLVVVRKQLGRQRHRAGLVLRQRGGHAQRADVELQGQLLRIEQRLERCQLGRQRVFAASGQTLTGQRRAGQAGVRDGQRLARRGVFGVAGAVVRDQGVAVVVAAVQKDAHQGLVAVGAEGRRFAHGRQAEGPGRGGAGEAKLAESAQEGAARRG